MMNNALFVLYNDSSLHVNREVTHIVSILLALCAIDYLSLSISIL